MRSGRRGGRRHACVERFARARAAADAARRRTRRRPRSSRSPGARRTRSRRGAGGRRAHGRARAALRRARRCATTGAGRSASSPRTTTRSSRSTSTAARGEVVETWTGVQVAWAMARGYEGQFGHALNAPWVWIPLALVFFLGLLDWRKPLRIAHLDLLVLLSFGVEPDLLRRGRDRRQRAARLPAAPLPPRAHAVGGVPRRGRAGPAAERAADVPDRRRACSRSRSASR